MGVGFKAANGKFFCAEGGGSGPLLANRDLMGSWETFELVENGDGTLSFRAIDGSYLSAIDGGGREVSATAGSIGGWERFRIREHGQERVSFAAPNAQYVCAEWDGPVVANRDAIGAGETFDRIWTGVSPALYGPDGRQYLNGDNMLVTREVVAYHDTTLEFSVPAYNEFAVLGHPSYVANAISSAPLLFERGNYTRSQESWSESGPDIVISGWYKDGPPDHHRPWRQARGVVLSSEVSWAGDVRTLRQVFGFADVSSEYGAAIVTLTSVGVMA